MLEKYTHCISTLLSIFRYLVLVKKHLKIKRATHEELTDIVTAPTYNQSSPNKPYRTAKLEGKDLDNPFTVGDGLMYGSIYNGPLTEGDVYSILYGALDKNGVCEFSAFLSFLSCLSNWLLLRFT